MYKIKMTANAFSTYGELKKGDVYTEKDLPKAYMQHLAHAVKVADVIEDDSVTKYDNKIVEDIEVKKPQSSQSSQPAKASKKKIVKKRSKKRQSSQ